MDADMKCGEKQKLNLICCYKSILINTHFVARQMQKNQGNAK